MLHRDTATVLAGPGILARIALMAGLITMFTTNLRADPTDDLRPISSDQAGALEPAAIDLVPINEAPLPIDDPAGKNPARDLLLTTPKFRLDDQSYATQALRG